MAGCIRVKEGRYRCILRILENLSNIDNARSGSAPARHAALFDLWLTCSLPRQTEDVVSFLEYKRKDAERWLNLDVYDALVPHSAKGPKERLFLCDVDAVLAIMKAERAPHNPAVLALLYEAVERHGVLGVRLKSLADEVSTPARQLGKWFRRYTGVSFRRFLRSLRIRHAVELLSRDEWSVSEIAVELEHTDPSNFVREFRSELGITPAGFRRMLKVTPQGDSPQPGQNRRQTKRHG